MINNTECRKLELGRSLVCFGKKLQRRGFVAGTDGNLSVRIDHARILTTPTRVNKGMMNAHDMVVVDLDGRKVSGFREASSEIGLHLSIYRMRSDVNAVVHAHPCTATAFACAGMALDEPLCSEVLITLGEVPLAPYETPGTPELSEAMAPFIASHDAILMANHGVVSYGPDLLSAYLNMEIVEHFASISLIVRQLGRCKLLGPDAIDQLSKARSRYRFAQPHN